MTGEKRKEDKTMKKIIMLGVMTVMVLFIGAYIASIHDGWYLTCEDGIETHVFYKTDLFGNRWITGTKEFWLQSR